MLKYLFALLVLFVPLSGATQSPSIARVSALANGKLLLNGRTVELPTMEQEFQRLKGSHGTVWYYRENPQSEPPPQAMDVIKLVIQYGLPLSMSSKPDFSDYVDANGRSQPRKP